MRPRTPASRRAGPAPRRPFGALVVLGLLSAAPAPAQEIVITPRLRAGDEIRLEVTREQNNSARPQQDGSSTTPVTVRVVEVTPERTTLDWAPGQTTFTNPLVAQNPLLLAASNAVSGIVLRLALDGDGGFAGLVNGADVAPKLQAAVDVIVNGLAEKLPPEQRPAFQKVLGQVLSPAVVLASVTRDAQIYFGLNGATLGVGVGVELPIDQPNPFGSGDIPATITIKAESATPETAVLVTTTMYDREALSRLARAIIEQSGAPLPPGALENLPTLDMDDTGRYVLDRTDGLMREVVVTRVMRAGPNQRRDGWAIKRLN